MADEALIKWTPESGWVAFVPSPLPGPAILSLMSRTLPVYRARLRGIGHGERKEAMRAAVDDLERMIIEERPCKAIVHAPKGKDLVLFNAEQGRERPKLISIGG